MELACPQCGATNRDDSVDFPFCTHCHESLVKCGYCAHFDAGAGVCRHPKSGRRQVSSDDMADCAQHRSILATTVAITQRVISPAKWVFVVAAALFALIVIGLYVQSGEQPRVGDITARVSWPPTVIAGQAFALEFTLANEDDRASGEVEIAIPAAFMDSFRVISVEPPYIREPNRLGQEPRPGERDKRYWHYYFQGVRTRDRVAITFQLVTNDDFPETGFPLGEGADDSQPNYTYDLSDDNTGLHIYNARKPVEFSVLSDELKIEVPSR